MARSARVFAKVLSNAGVAALMLAATGCGRTVAMPAAASATPTVSPPEAVLELGWATAQVGWVIALPNGLAVTHDGGRTWRLAVDTNGTKPAAASAYFRSSSFGWLLELGPVSQTGRRVSVMQTTDGGLTWVPQTPFTLPSYEDFGSGSVFFTDGLHGWIQLVAISSPNFSRAYLFRTTDGGLTWTQLSMPFAGRMRFVDTLNGWTLGGLSGGQLAVTHDGGSTWTAESVGTPFGPPIAGLSAALKVIGSGAIFAMSTWDEQAATLDANFFVAQAPDFHWARIRHLSRPSRSGTQVVLIDTQQWILAGRDGVSVTQDAGRTWTQTGGRALGWWSIDFATANSGLAALSWGSCASFKSNCSVHAELIRTQDGGRTWDAVSLPN